MLAFLFLPMAFAQYANSGLPVLRFNYNNGQWLIPRDEFFLRTLCGNGGCEYPIFDGRTYVYLGSVFGSEIWLLRHHSHALPVIESFSHLSALLGTIGRYEFNCSRYEKVLSREIGNEETQLLYKRLDAIPRIKAQ